MELNLNRNLLNRWRFDHFPVANQFFVEKVAFTSDSHLFVQGFDQQAKIQRIYTLERVSSSWGELKQPPSGRLEGTDGNIGVFGFTVGPNTSSVV